MYYLKGDAGGSVFAAIQDKEALLWHQCLGHPSIGSLTALSADFGFQLNKTSFECCDICHRAKQTRNKFLLVTLMLQGPLLWFIVIYGVITELLHLVVATIFCALWMITIELYEFICLKIKLKCMRNLLVSVLW